MIKPFYNIIHIVGYNFKLQNFKVAKLKPKFSGLVQKFLFYIFSISFQVFDGSCTIFYLSCGFLSLFLFSSHRLFLLEKVKSRNIILLYVLYLF